MLQAAATEIYDFDRTFCRMFEQDILVALSIQL